MQLILNPEDIDIKRNMSTIEHESLSEKFPDNDKAESIAEDITSGNKENIHKQENIIPVVEDVVDPSKEVNVSNELILNTDLNGVVSNGDECITEVENTLEKNVCVSNDDNTDQRTETDDLANVSEDITPGKDNSLRLGDIEFSNVTVEESQENSIIPETIDSHPTLNEPSAHKNESKLEILTKTQNNCNIRTNDQNTTSQDKLDDDFKITTTVVSGRKDKDKLDGDETNVSYMSEQEETDVNVKTCVSNASNELNKQCEIEVDKEIDIADLCSELKEENKIDEDDNVDKVSEEPSNKETCQSVVPNNEVDKNEIIECDVIESSNLNNACDAAIELDDEDTKLVTCNKESSQKVKGLQDKTEEIKTIDGINSSTSVDTKTPEIVEKQIATIQKVAEEPIPPKSICRLSNNLDIFSDEEDEVEPIKDIQPATEKQCINIDDDDDIMLVDEDSNTKDCKTKDSSTNDGSNIVSKESPKVPETSTTNEDVCMGNEEVTEAIKESHPLEKDAVHISEPAKEICSAPASDSSKPAVEKPTEPEPPKKPLLPKNFVNTCKKNLADMTRDDLEEFCILKIVESVVDRSNLGEIKAQLKLLTQTMEECKKKCLMLSKQNKDLQVVLKSVQEEQKSGSDHHITPLKITRSVGMQVVMVADRNNQRKKSLPVNGVGLSPANVAQPAPKPTKAQQQNTRNQKEKASSNPIPKPRLVPAAPAAKPTPQPSPKQSPTVPNGMRNSPPVQKVAEKRPRAHSFTVDLTDDEPPAKQPAGPRGGTPQAMRFAPPQPKALNVPPTQRFASVVNSPRKVYIPIGGPQAQNNMGNRTLMLKPMAAMGPRAVASSVMAKVPRGPVPMARVQNYRHPAPLPDAMKQYQPPNWKLLPPAPDLKLSKVENGIVISWKIDGYLVENHEEIASYQLYAYQETTSPPSTALWKKIGDVKALPLPMACTLTQFMAGFKYYFAVRAVDIRSRFGPFSLPGSILLLNKI